MIDCNGITWVNYYGALIPDVPPHVPVEISREGTRFLLENSKAHFLRWHTAFDTPVETPYWHVIKDTPTQLEHLSRNSRNQVRKGFKNGTVGRIDPRTLARIGYIVYRKAMDSYRGDLRTLSSQDFSDMILGQKDNAEIEYWGVRNNQGALIAYAQNRIQEKSCNFQVIKLDPEYLKMYAGYALIFEMTSHYLNERGFAYVNDGARSIRHDTGIQDFLIRKFGFRKAYSRLHIVYSLKLGLLVRALFPLRSAFGAIPLPRASEISALLNQEKIHREGNGQRVVGHDQKSVNSLDDSIDP